MQMLHAVSSVFGKSKELAALFQRHWNARVSPGEAIYAQRGEGELLVAKARRSGHAPVARPHRKDVFL